MSNRAYALRLAGLLLCGGVGVLAGPAHAQTETSVADLLAGTAVPHAVKLKDLTPEWRRLTVTGDAMLGMGGMVQSMMQSLGAMFGGGGASDALYTRGAQIKLGDQIYLVGYRLPSQGIDFGSIMALGAAAAGGGGGVGAPPPKPEAPAVTPDSELALVLINMRTIASISDIRPFNLAEATKPAGPGLMDMFKNMPEPARPAPPPAKTPAPSKPTRAPAKK